MKYSWLAVLSMLAILLSLLFNPGVVHAQTGASGTVIGWGANTYGQSSVPAAIGDITAIAAGWTHTLALKADGTVVAWGRNNAGQTNVPAGLGNVAAIAAGWEHSLALKPDGTVVAWGSNSFGQGTVPSGLSGVTAIAAGDFHSLALKADGTVVAWGNNVQGQCSVPGGLSNVTAISAGGAHSLALKVDGTVVAWGNNAQGQSSVPLGLSSVTAIASGGYHNLALTANGHIVGWGDNSYWQLPPSSMSGFYAIAAGYYHSLALKADGTVVGWGDNSYGQSIVPAGVSGVAAIAAGGNHSLALKSVSAALAWGNLSYAPAGVSGVTTIAAGHYHNLVLKADGTVYMAVMSDHGLGSVPAGLNNVTAIGGGYDHSLALKVDGSVVAWGNNNHGQLDLPDGLNLVTAIAVGNMHSLALRADGTVIAWGDLYHAGDNMPEGLSGVSAIAAGNMHSLALKADGTVVAWGCYDSRWYDFGQCSVPAGLSGVTVIAAGNFHNLALKADGTVVAWGSNRSGVIDVPADLSGVVAIAAGAEHSLALKADGTIVIWGGNRVGEGNYPAGLTGYTAIDAGDYHNLVIVPDHDGDGVTDVFDNCPVTPNTDQADSDYNGVGNACQVAITIQPENQAAYLRDAVSFDAAASGDPAPSLKWQVSMDSGATWTDIAGATASPLTFTADLDQSGNRYRAVFTNGRSSATSRAATLTVTKRLATVTCANLTQTYDGQPKPVTVTTDPVGLSVVVTYDGSPTVPTTVGSYVVVAMIDDTTYQGSASGTLIIQPKAASVTPAVAGKVYGDNDPALSGVLVGFLEADGAIATYSRAAGEAAGSYTISATLSLSGSLDNYAITYNTAAFTIHPRSITVAAEAKSKNYGELDPELTYTVTSGALAFNDGFNGALTRVPGEAAGVYPILQGTLALDGNYTLTYVGANLTILAAPVAQDQSLATNEDTALEIILVATDADNDPLTYSIVDAPTHGALSGAAPTVTYTPNSGYFGPDSFTFKANDGTVDSNVATVSIHVIHVNHPPEAQDQSLATNEGTALDITLAATDIDNDVLTYAIVDSPAHGVLSGTAPEVIYTPDAGYSGSDSFTYKANDGAADSNVATVSITVSQTNTAPTANPGGPYLGAINTSIQFDASLSSDPENDPMTYAWTFGDGGTGTGAAPTHSYTAAGIYDVCLTVNDGSLDSSPVCTIAVVYDPSAGFVTGGGWIDSPAGAYKEDPSLMGKATFGFVAKYLKGAKVPSGNTEFQFQAGGFKFHSTSYEWLVVNQSGTNAQFKGSGLVNGAADPNGSAYKFMLWASDGSSTNSVDTFRIRIWWEDDAGEHDVYDNGVDQPIGGGSIVVHTKK